LQKLLKSALLILCRRLPDTVVSIAVLCCSLLYSFVLKWLHIHKYRRLRQIL